MFLHVQKHGVGFLTGPSQQGLKYLPHQKWSMEECRQFLYSTQQHQGEEDISGLWVRDFCSINHGMVPMVPMDRGPAKTKVYNRLSQ